VVAPHRPIIIIIIIIMMHHGTTSIQPASMEK
jgi:hypothetical protein